MNNLKESSRYYRVAIEHALEILENWICLEELDKRGPSDLSGHYRLLHTDLAQMLVKGDQKTEEEDIRNIV